MTVRVHQNGGAWFFTDVRGGLSQRALWLLLGPRAELELDPVKLAIARKRGIVNTHAYAVGHLHEWGENGSPPVDPVEDGWAPFFYEKPRGETAGGRFLLGTKDCPGAELLGGEYLLFLPDQTSYVIGPVTLADLAATHPDEEALPDGDEH